MEGTWIAGTKFIDSEGGPLILMPRKVLPQWHGCFLETPEGLKSPYALDSENFIDDTTDYDRACSIDGYCGAVKVGDCDCLILNDQPMLTAWMPQNSGGLFVRWFHGPGDEAMETFFSAPIPTSYDLGEVSFTIDDEDLVLFDSACHGSDVEEWLDVRLQAGTYTVTTAHYRPHDDVWFVCAVLARK